MSMEREMDRKFAGFSRAEWLAAMTGALGRGAANSYVGALFTRIGDAPSNGYAIMPETWARLALVSPGGEERVRAATRDYPADVLKQIEEHKLILSRSQTGG